MDSKKSIDGLVQVLKAATKRCERLWKLLGPDFSTKGSTWQEYEDARRERLLAQRDLAAAKGEEYVVPLEFPAQWDVGAPLPYVLINDSQTFLTFYLREHDPDWDGTYVTVRHPSDPSPSRIAVVEFYRCVAAKMGSPNDEVHEGHRWADRGLESYTAQEVINSRWVAELEAINSVHRCYTTESWKQLHHYVLWFHDSTFECIAESFDVVMHSKSLTDVLAEICGRLVE